MSYAADAHQLSPHPNQIKHPESSTSKPITYISFLYLGRKNSKLNYLLRRRSRQLKRGGGSDFKKKERKERMSEVTVRPEIYLFIMNRGSEITVISGTPTMQSASLSFRSKVSLASGGRASPPTRIVQSVISTPSGTSATKWLPMLSPNPIGSFHLPPMSSQASASS
jgi:hypothetical protein